MSLSVIYDQYLIIHLPNYSSDYILNKKKQKM